MSNEKPEIESSNMSGKPDCECAAPRKPQSIRNDINKQEQKQMIRNWKQREEQKPLSWKTLIES
jgi:hypothetical protein